MGFYNIVLEGQQAEEYLKRKQTEINRSKEEDNAKYHNNNCNGSHGPRVAQPWHWSGKEDGKYKYGDPEYARTDIDRNVAYYSNSPIARNPRHAATMQRQARYEELKRKNPDSTPSYKRTKDDDDLDKAKANYEKELEYANRMARANGANKDNSSGNVNITYGRDTDAARRHYRRHHKNEACGIFESVEFLND